MALIAPALLSADFARLGEALGIIKSAGASMIHVDVMDGHFTPDLTVGQPVIASLRRSTDLVLDVRLAIERPERFIAEFVKAGADRVSVHPESTPDLYLALDLIRRQGVKAGVAMNPATPLSSVVDALEELDYLTVVAAESGLDQGTFIPGSMTKVGAAARMRDERRLEFAIQVEGGVGLNNLEQLIRAGADILVAGSAIFHSDNPKGRLTEMIHLASEMRQPSRV